MEYKDGDEVMQEGALVRGHRRPWFKSDGSNLRYVKGKRKYWAGKYLSGPVDGPYRTGFRQFIGRDRKSATADQKILRSALGYWGPGDYRKTFSKYVPKGSFSYMGRQLGAASGIPGMNAAGAWAGNKFANMVGFGDYGPVTGNQLTGDVQPSQINVNKSDYSGDIVFQNSEFLGNVSVTGSAGGSSSFQTREYAVNPGLPGSFPFASQIAGNYELYELCGLVYQYKPLSGEYNTSGQNLGKVILACQYDPDATVFASSVQMENYAYSNSGKPSVGLVHGVETARNQRLTNMLYVRTGVSTKDKVLTDIGTMVVATEGVPLPSGSTQIIIGELWVTYMFKLSRPQLGTNIVGNNIGWCSWNSDLTNVLNPSIRNPRSTLDATLTRVGLVFNLTLPSSISSGTYMIVVYTTSIWTTPGKIIPGTVSQGGAGEVAASDTDPYPMYMSKFFADAPGATRCSVSFVLSNYDLAGTIRVMITEVQNTFLNTNF